MKNIVKICSLMTIFALTLSACQQPSDTVQIEFRAPVSVADVEVGAIEHRIVTTGILRAPEVATLIVQTTGILQLAKHDQSLIAEGDYIKAGELIANITGEEAALSIKREVVKQQLQTAENNLRATEVLFEKKLMSVAQLGQAKDALEEARLAYRVSLNTESQNQIRSPIDGVILQLTRDEQQQKIANGQLMKEGQVVAVVGPLEQLVADVNLVSMDVAQVKPQQDTVIRTNIWSDKTFSGSIQRIAPIIDSTTRTLTAEVLINNQDLLLKPGMVVEVAIIVEKKEQAILVPSTAITERGGRNVVFVLDGQRVEQREIALGIREGERVEVKSGLAAGDSVVILGLDTLTNQMPVTVTSR